MLTPKRQRFVEEYLIDLNATQAYIRAGYSANGAHKNAAFLMANHDIRAAIAETRDRRSVSTGITTDYILGRLRDNLERSMQAEPVLDAKGKETGEYSYQGGVANRAAELLGKHLGMFVDRSEVTTKALPPEEREQRVVSILSAAKRRKTA